MREDNNIWSKNFNDPSLEHEDWLTPSPEILENIARDLFDDKEEKKIPIWIWITILMLTVGTLVVLSASSLGQSQDHDSNYVKEEIVAQNLDSDLGTTELLRDSKEFLNTNTDQMASQVENNQDAIAETVIDNRKISDTVDKDYQNGDSKSMANSEILGSKSHIVSEGSISRVLEKNNKGTSDLENNLINAVVKSPKVITIDPISGIELKTLSSEDEFLIMKPALSQPIIKAINKPKRSSLAFNSGVSLWQFELNETYENVLQPADFRYTNAQGFNISIQYNYNIAKNLNIMTFASIEKIEFDSGHNSSVEYKLNNESEDTKQNTFDLDMASPLGFLQSEIIIQRSSQAQTAATDIVVDLNNHHTIKNINLGLGLLQGFDINSKVRAELGLSASINRVFGIENSLDKAGINIMGFETVNQMVTQDQELINEWVPSVGYQMGLSYTLSPHFSLGAQWTSSFSVTPIYQESDFSTRFNRHLAQMNLQYHF